MGYFVKCRSNAKLFELLIGLVLISYLFCGSVQKTQAAGFIDANPLTFARSEHSATLLPTGKVLVAGGVDNNGAVVLRTESYDPTTDTWASAGSLTVGRASHTAILLPNGKVLVVGGFGSGLEVHASAELYDPVSNSWSVAASLPHKRFGHTATLLSNGKVLIVGGGDRSSLLLNSEVYDPATNTWSVAGSLAAGRAGHTATRLPSGKVLVAGGLGGSYLATAELYDPVIDTWSSVGDLNHRRADHSATLLPSGKVLVAGGHTDSDNDQGIVKGFALHTVELFDPTTNLWLYTGFMTAPHETHSASLLPNGKVLVVSGGLPPPFGVYDGVDLFDTGTGTWSDAGRVGMARSNATTTLLPNGNLLLVGGNGVGDPSLANRVELYMSTPSFADAWRPTLINSPISVSLGQRLALIGTLFTGVSDASSGRYNSSASNLPVAVLRSIATGKQAYLGSDPATPWTATTLTTAPVSQAFPKGTAELTIYVNGIPSVAKTIAVLSASSVSAVALTSSLKQGALGKIVTLTASVTGTTPTGTVVFFDGPMTLGAPVVLSGSSSATLETSELSVGDHFITAVYSGDSANGSSTSPALSLTVNTSTSDNGGGCALNSRAAPDASLLFLFIVAAAGLTFRPRLRCDSPP